MLRIASWNINSIRLRLPLVEKYLKQYNVDILCLQETKVVDDLFPIEIIKLWGYPYIQYVGEKSYNGVAIISKIPLLQTQEVKLANKNDTRYIKTNIDVNYSENNTKIIKQNNKYNIWQLHNFYVPAGGEIPDPTQNDKFAHKLLFLDEIENILVNKKNNDKVIIVGDFNIAPYEHDVYSSKALKNVVSHTQIERQKLLQITQNTKMIDCFREITPQNTKLYSWWSYRSKNWEKSNRGRRLDHIYISQNMKQNLIDAKIVKQARAEKSPSDHVMIYVDIKTNC